MFLKSCKNNRDCGAYFEMVGFDDRALNRKKARISLWKHASPGNFSEMTGNACNFNNHHMKRYITIVSIFYFNANDIRAEQK